MQVKNFIKVPIQKKADLIPLTHREIEKYVILKSSKLREQVFELENSYISGWR